MQQGTTTSASVVIIGAGIMGCATAHHLASRGVTDVIVLEKDQIAAGSTSDAAGGIRLQFSTEENIRLSQISFETWENYEQLFGIDIGFRQQGYLLLITNPSDVPVFRDNMALQNRLGVPTQWLDQDEIRELNSSIMVDDVLGATFCARDGWADTSGSTMGFAQSARRQGVRILEGVEVTGIETQSGKVTGVETDQGTIGTELVINCAGPWAGMIGDMAGIDVPVQPYRRQSWVTAPFDGIPGTVPFTVEFGSGLYFHPEGAGFLFGMANPDDPPGFNRMMDGEWMHHAIQSLCRRAPAFEDAAIRTGWAGFYEVTPDHNPLIGYHDQIDGMIVAAGFSGHGFMQGPAVGQCVAELVLNGEATSVNLSPFAIDRFRTGRAAREHNVI